MFLYLFVLKLELVGILITRLPWSFTKNGWSVLEFIERSTESVFKDEISEYYTFGVPSFAGVDYSIGELPISLTVLDFLEV